MVRRLRAASAQLEEYLAVGVGVLRLTCALQEVVELDEGTLVQRQRFLSAFAAFVGEFLVDWLTTRSALRHGAS